MQVQFIPSEIIPYAGNNVTLNCVITLNGGVTDNDVSVMSMWTRNATVFSGINGRVTVRGTYELLDTIYSSQLMFSPLSSSMDNGRYTCMASLTPQLQSQFVTGASGEGSVEINVVGKNL